jgi:ketosteroid isomerase-like protein
VVAPGHIARARARPSRGDRVTAHALIEAELRWSDAVRRGDRAAAGAFMARDFTSVTAGSTDAPLGRSAWLARVSVPSTLAAFASDDFDVRVIGDVALVQSRCLERSATGPGEPTATIMRFRDIWRRAGSTWHIGYRYVGLGRA